MNVNGLLLPFRKPIMELSNTSSNFLDFRGGNSLAILSRNLKLILTYFLVGNLELIHMLYKYVINCLLLFSQRVRLIYVRFLPIALT